MTVAVTWSLLSQVKKKCLSDLKRHRRAKPSLIYTISLLPPINCHARPASHLTMQAKSSQSFPHTTQVSATRLRPEKGSADAAASNFTLQHEPTCLGVRKGLGSGATACRTVGDKKLGWLGCGGHTKIPRRANSPQASTAFDKFARRASADLLGERRGALI